MLPKSQLNYLLPSALMIFAIILLPLTPTQAADECFAKYSKTNICDFAKKVQREMAPSLPMQISSNLVVRNIVSVGPLVQISAMLKYNENFMNNSLKKQGVKRSLVDARMRKMTQNVVCSNDAMSAFLGLGGKIAYHYNFNDGVEYLRMELDSNTCE